MKILIIGGTGVISKHVCDYIIKKGNQVTVINRGVRSQLINNYVKYIKADINNINIIQKEIAVCYFDAVIDFVSFNEIDILNRYKVFNGKIGQYIFISSATVYKVKEGIVTEMSPLGNDYNLYAQNKIACEKMLREMCADSFPVTVVRPSHTFDSTVVPLGIHGKNGSWQNVKRMIQGNKVIIHDEGLGFWSMLRSEDFARIIYRLIGSIKAIGETFQITHDDFLKWIDIYKIVADELDVELKPCFVSSEILANEGFTFDLKAKLYGDKARSITFINKKVKKITGDITPIYSMEEGIRESVRTVCSNKCYQKDDLQFDIWCDFIVEKYGQREIG